MEEQFVGRSSCSLFFPFEFHQDPPDNLKFSDCHLLTQSLGMCCYRHLGSQICEKTSKYFSMSKSRAGFVQIQSTLPYQQQAPSSTWQQLSPLQLISRSQLQSTHPKTPLFVEMTSILHISSLIDQSNCINPLPPQNRIFQKSSPATITQNGV